MIIEDNLKAFFRLNKLLYGAHVSYGSLRKMGNHCEQWKAKHIKINTFV